MWTDGRVRVRPWREDEAPRMLAVQRVWEVVRWLSDDPVLMADLDEALARIRSDAALLADDTPRGVWAVEEVTAGVPAGSVMLVDVPHGDGALQVGWHLHPDSHGRGLASAGARLVLEHAFGAGVPEVSALTHTDNEPSKAVCRRIGMTDRGVVERWYEGESQWFTVSAGQWAATGGRPGPA